MKVNLLLSCANSIPFPLGSFSSLRARIASRVSGGSQAFSFTSAPSRQPAEPVPQSKPQPRPYPGASPFGATGPRLGPPSWPLGHPRCPCRHLPAAGQAKSRHPIARLLPFLPSLSPSPVEPLPPPTARRRLGNGGGRHRLPAEGRC